MRGILSDEDLSRIALAAQVNLLGVDLVGDIDQKHIKEVVGDMVRLEHNLDFI